MRLYATPPIITEETGYYVINEPNKSAHKEDLSTTPIYILEEKNGSYFLNKFDENGTLFSDTWHPNAVEAKEQAEFEYNRYGKPLNHWDWKEIPENIKDPIKFVLSQLEKTKE